MSIDIKRCELLQMERGYEMGIVSGKLFSLDAK